MVPALLVSALVLVAIVPGRTTRVWILLVSGAAVAAALPWTLDVYASRDALRPAAPDSELLRAAAIATAVGALAAGVRGHWRRGERGWHRFGAVATGAAGLAAVGVLAAGAMALDDPAAGARGAVAAFHQQRGRSDDDDPLRGRGRPTLRPVASRVAGVRA